MIMSPYDRTPRELHYPAPGVGARLGLWGGKTLHRNGNPVQRPEHETLTAAGVFAQAQGRKQRAIGIKPPQPA